MKNKLVTIFIFNCVCACLTSSANANEMTNAVKLTYQEIEESIDPYIVTYTVSSNHIRIDDESDSSGYIIYDIKENRIFSVSHYDQSILVIPEYRVNDFKPDFKIDIEYMVLEDAPTISGKKVYSYRVKVVTDTTSENCMDIQLVPGLLPAAASTLQKFQGIMSGQHVTTLGQTPEEYRTPCYLVDQVYNKGDYYSKGLPIQEWHSNGKIRQLLNFEDVEVDASIFKIPQEYRRYSLK